MTAIALAGTDADVLQLADPASGRIWRSERRLISRINGKVRQRLLANFLVPIESLDSLAMPRFLEAVEFRSGMAHLSTCIIDMVHAAPDWAPQALAPSCVGVALRVTCRDRRDGTSAVFVGTRYSNSFLTPMLGFLGVAGFAQGLTVVGTLGGTCCVETPEWQLRVEAGVPDAAAPNFSPPVFDALIAAGIASYGSPAADGESARIDLHKQCQSGFSRQSDRRSHLIWQGHDFQGDLRVSHGGSYAWQLKH